MRTMDQKILRRVRDQLKLSLKRFQRVNDDSLGRTYRTQSPDGKVWVIIEIGDDGDFERSHDGVMEETSATGYVLRLYYTVRTNHQARVQAR